MIEMTILRSIDDEPIIDLLVYSSVLYYYNYYNYYIATTAKCWYLSKTPFSTVYEWIG